jgi:hypothetical protein
MFGADKIYITLRPKNKHLYKTNNY